MIDKATRLRWEHEDRRSQRVRDGLGGEPLPPPFSDSNPPESAGADFSLPPMPPFGGAQVGGSSSPGSPTKPSEATLLAFRMGMELGAHIERTGGLE